MARKLDEQTKRARAIARGLDKLYPDAKCSLHYASPLQLLVATILSAQCTDDRVNMVTPPLFERYPDAAAFATATIGDLEKAIQSTGFFRNKAKNIQAACQRILDVHNGDVPTTMEELILLPGVARKTANVVLGNAFGIPGLPVDTHVGRLSRRMGLTEHKDPVKVEKDLCDRLPPKEWTIFGHRMIYHGRKVCQARKPDCSACAIEKLCPRVGVAP
ncbi:Ultraviolet N-glycosylase/AP lyase [Planctomycetes bacterium Pan216]|uniref:Endonuclease III n=1 Tax=Kolteria novifilia TaxID=2527975 RepID=A0A518B8N7_9BACT|nr:Ultraviolet N-glycosylase/AP lyase [Planctomycetes bacterium Pan216]